jgi:hypothetical protein
MGRFLHEFQIPRQKFQPHVYEAWFCNGKNNGSACTLWGEFWCENERYQVANSGLNRKGPNGT